MENSPRWDVLGSLKELLIYYYSPSQKMCNLRLSYNAISLQWNNGKAFGFTLYFLGKRYLFAGLPLVGDIARAESMLHIFPHALY